MLFLDCGLEIINKKLESSISVFNIWFDFKEKNIPPKTIIVKNAKDNESKQ